MYSVDIFYLLQNADLVQHHSYNITETYEEGRKSLIEVYEFYKNLGLEVYEVIATKDIQSLKEVLKEEGRVYLRLRKI